MTKIESTVPWTYVISDLNGEEIVRIFYEKELQTTNQEKFRIEKVITRKGSIMELYPKQEGYDNCFFFIVGLIKKDIAWR